MKKILLLLFVCTVSTHIIIAQKTEAGKNVPAVPSTDVVPPSPPAPPLPPEPPVLAVPPTPPAQPAPPIKKEFEYL